MPPLQVRRISSYVCLILLFISACTPMQGPLHPRNKARLSSVAVVALPIAPDILDFQPAATRQEAAKRDASHYAKLWALPGAFVLLCSFSCGSEDCLIVAGAGLATMLVGGTLGALYGAGRGVLQKPTPRHEAETYMHAVHTALTELTNAEELRQEFLTLAAQKSPYPFVPLPGNLDAQADALETLDDSVPPVNAKIEMFVESYGLEGAATQQKHLVFVLNVKTRFYFPLRKMILRNEYSYRSAGLPHEEWARDNGAQLVQEKEKGIESISRQIIDDLFD